MDTSEVISLISIIASSLVGVLGVIVSAVSLIGARKDKTYMLRHTERLNEQKAIVEIISNYISSVSVAKLETLLRRAAAKKSAESVSDFMKSSEMLLNQIESYTVEIISVPEISDNAIREEILSLRKNHIKIINAINDLKAGCAMDRLTSTQEDDLVCAMNRILEQIYNTKTVHEEIVQELHAVIKKYINRVEW